MPIMHNVENLVEEIRIHCEQARRLSEVPLFGCSVEEMKERSKLAAEHEQKANELEKIYFDWRSACIASQC